MELDTSDKFSHEINVGYRWNFVDGTSKEYNYLNSAYIKTFLMTTLKSIKLKEGNDILKFSPRKGDDNAKGF